MIYEPTIENSNDEVVMFDRIQEYALKNVISQTSLEFDYGSIGSNLRMDLIAQRTAETAVDLAVEAQMIKSETCAYCTDDVPVVVYADSKPACQSCLDIGWS